MRAAEGAHHPSLRTSWVRRAPKSIGGTWWPASHDQVRSQANHGAALGTAGLRIPSLAFCVVARARPSGVKQLRGAAAGGGAEGWTEGGAWPQTPVRRAT